LAGAPAPGKGWARRLVLAACVLAWAAALAATHVPAGSLPRMPATDVVLHVTGFAGLTSLFVLAQAAYGVPRRRRLILTLPVMAAYAAVDELTQPLVNRVAAMGDWTADVGGAAMAIVCGELILLAAAMLGRRASPASRSGCAGGLTESG
jgi:VanZ family protein